MTTVLLAALAMTALPQPAATPFPLADVRLTGGPWDASRRACERYLLEIEPDRLLSDFRVHSGLPAKGKRYGGWESSGLAGHTLGHYLSALAQAYAETGDARFKTKLDYTVDELAACQANRPDGYLGAIPDGDAKWAQVRKGDIHSGGFDLNGMWSPWYTVHKVLAGLLDADALGGNRTALQVAARFADWAIDETKGLDDAQWQRMLACEYGGMNEALAELYARMGEAKYLELSRRFYDHRVLDPLAEGKDDLAGKHSNTQIPKIIGLARLYETTGDPKDRDTARFFWDAVVDHHTYAIGGNSNGEYLGPPDRLRDTLTSNTCESCNTYNMLKLTRHLFAWDPKARTMDYYERAYLNHILGSEDPERGGFTYFMPLASGAHREHSDPWDTFTCCHGTGLENHTKHGDTAYFHDGAKTLWVNLFMPTELRWREAGVRLRQETAFPQDNAVALTVEEGAHPFEMRLRHPGWAKGPIVYRVNGKPVLTSSTPGTYATIRRTWKKGDRLEFSLPMALRTEAMPDDPKRIAVLYGPVVLAADLGPAKGPAPRTPVLVTGDRPAGDWLKPVPGKPLEFSVAGAARPEPLRFVPFYTLHENRYATYFDEFTPAQWETEEAAYRAEEARRKDLKARTVDEMAIGQMQPERDHHLESERNDVRDANGRTFRTPLNGGWTLFELRVDPAAEQELVLTTWGNERVRPDFSILVDGVETAVDTLADKPMNRFSDTTYSLPPERTRGKTRVTIRVQARPGKGGPSLVHARIVRRA